MHTHQIVYVSKEVLLAIRSTDYKSCISELC